MSLWYPKWYPRNSGCVVGTRGMGEEPRRTARYAGGSGWGGVGQTWGVHSLVYDTGVRMVMPQNEYELNTNLTEADMGASCSANQSPV